VLPREPGDPGTIGRYQVLSRIGAGGMAIIYFGRSETGRAVAIKVMHGEFAGEPEYRERFRREIAATRVAGGRYSPGVLDAEPDAGNPWLVTEFVPSVSLRDAVRAYGPFPADAVWGLGAGLAEALATIHAAGIVHLDLKPANVLLTTDGPRVIDFGIAGPPHAAVTTPAGSAGFMSPEQRAGRGTGPASDVYSLGATLAFAVGDHQDARLRELIERCRRPDPTDRPKVPELIAELSLAQPDADWLPPAVAAEIRRRTDETANPPMAVDRTPHSPVPRRALLIGLGGVLLAGGGGTVWLMHPLATPAPGTAAPRHMSATSSMKATTVAQHKTRQLEIYAFGTATLKSMTTVVNDQSETVTNVPLPWSRTVTIPDLPTQSTYHIAYTCSKGNFTWTLLVDGYDYGGGGGSSTQDDLTDSKDGTI
jgi:hypothetical protein